MSRENSYRGKDSIQLQVSRRRQGSASRAYCPSKMRAYTLTNKQAQRHRILLLRILRNLDSLGILRLCQRISLPGPVTMTHIVQLALILLLVGMVMVLSTFYQWSHVIMLTLICMLTTIVVTHLLFKQPTAQQVSTPHFTHLQPEQFIPRSVPGNQLQTRIYSFPDTPMPATPLIRVLETIDLSSTNVEHFLDINAQTPPKTEIDLYEPSINQPEASNQALWQGPYKDMLT